MFFFWIESKQPFPDKSRQDKRSGVTPLSSDYPQTALRSQVYLRFDVRVEFRAANASALRHLRFAVWFCTAQSA